MLKEKRKKKMKKNRRVRLLSLGFLFEKEVGGREKKEKGEGVLDVKRGEERI